MGFPIHFPSWVLRPLTLGPFSSMRLLFILLNMQPLFVSRGSSVCSVSFKLRQRRLIKRAYCNVLGYPWITWTGLLRDWDCTTVGRWEPEDFFFYYAQNDPVFTTSRAARVMHTHFEKESVVYQMCSLSFSCNRTGFESSVYFTSSVVSVKSFPSLDLRDYFWQNKDSNASLRELAS